MADRDLRETLASIITGTESPVTPPSDSSSGTDDELTPFPSPMLSAKSLAGLSLSSDGELEPEVDLDRVISEEDKAKAVDMKTKANKAFAAKDFNASIDLYTEAISLDPHDPTFWNNRAMAKAKMEEHGAAIADASQAIQLNPAYGKAYYRRGISYLAILRPTDAVPDFKKALEIEPGNRAARDQLNATVKLIRRIEFEKAISIGESETASERCLSLIETGACAFDPSQQPNMPIPIIPEDPKARYKPTKEFVEGMIEGFKKGGKVSKRVAWEIILGVKEIALQEKSLVEVEVPKGVTCDVVGDTHGQFYDLCNLLDIIKPPSEDHMILFNGDFVDSWSIEVALTVFAYKWLYPHRVFLNRGNHETNDMNKVYGFEGEAKSKHGEQTYKLFADVFTARKILKNLRGENLITVPLATLLTASEPPSTQRSPGTAPLILSPKGKKRYLVVHGGPPVSKDGVTLADISKVERYGRQPGQEGIMCEMLWTDPQEQPGRSPSKRGVGLAFGPDVTKRFCDANGITSIIRSHEVRQEGYAVEQGGLCITVFSAPNYCDQTGNKGAVVRMKSDGELSYEQFINVPHPDVKPMAYAGGFGMM